jgi:hypothetical protein
VRDTRPAIGRRDGRTRRFGTLPLLAVLFFGCGATDDSQARGAAVVRSSRETASIPEPPSVPGPPEVLVERDLATGNCHVTWTPPADDGGSARLGYLVTTESPPAPPTDGGAIGTALQVARTTGTVADVEAGSSVTVAAENAVGAGLGVHRVCA